MIKPYSKDYFKRCASRLKFIDYLILIVISYIALIAYLIHPLMLAFLLLCVSSVVERIPEIFNENMIFEQERKLSEYEEQSVFDEEELIDPARFNVVVSGTVDFHNMPLLLNIFYSVKIGNTVKLLLLEGYCPDLDLFMFRDALNNSYKEFVIKRSKLVITGINDKTWQKPVVEEQIKANDPFIPESYVEEEWG